MIKYTEPDGGLNGGNDEQELSRIFVCSNWMDTYVLKWRILKDRIGGLTKILFWILLSNIKHSRRMGMSVIV